MPDLRKQPKLTIENTVTGVIGDYIGAAPLKVTFGRYTSNQGDVAVKIDGPGGTVRWYPERNLVWAFGASYPVPSVKQTNEVTPKRQKLSKAALKARADFDGLLYGMLSA